MEESAPEPHHLRLVAEYFGLAWPFCFLKSTRMDNALYWKFCFFLAIGLKLKKSVQV
jgi:hypothetical protein